MILYLTFSRCSLSMSSCLCTARARSSASSTCCWRAWIFFFTISMVFPIVWFFFFLEHEREESRRRSEVWRGDGLIFALMFQAPPKLCFFFFFFILGQEIRDVQGGDGMGGRKKKRAGSFQEIYDEIVQSYAEARLGWYHGSEGTGLSVCVMSLFSMWVGVWVFYCGLLWQT